MKKESKIKLEHAELFFKFALGISSHILILDKPLEYYGQFSFGKHSVKKEELELNRKQERMGSSMLEHVATYIMMLQLDKVLEDEWGERRVYSKDNEVRTISQVVRSIRNAFAHDPFNPKWKISRSAKDQEFVIPNILTLKTHEIDGTRVRRMEYGGPLALLRLLQYTREKLKTHH